VEEVELSGAELDQDEAVGSSSVLIRTYSTISDQAVQSILNKSIQDPSSSD